MLLPAVIFGTFVKLFQPVLAFGNAS